MGARVLEIAVQDVEGVRVGARVGAGRVELCSALGSTGGLTPSAGLLAAAVAAGRDLGVEVHPLVRPRPGGFVYGSDELDVQVRDVRAAVDAGAAGVVVGALTPEGQVDEIAVAALVAAAQGREVTFHRAFDVLDDVAAAVESLVALGVTRVLTSGGAPTAGAGLDRLAATVASADGRLQVMAGGGVRAQDVADLLGAGVDAVHLSAKAVVSDAGGPGGGGDSGYEVTDEALAAEASAALRAADSRAS